MIWTGYGDEFAPPKYEYSRAGRSDDPSARGRAEAMVSQGWEPAETTVRSPGFERDFRPDGQGDSHGLYFRRISPGYVEPGVAAMGAELAADMQADRVERRLPPVGELLAAPEVPAELTPEPA